MKKILVVSGHTDIDHSVANRTIIEELEKMIPGVVIDYLDKLYPTYNIDVSSEQEKLLDCDIIVLQYPLFWYSMPSLLECWMENVFVHGFTHGVKEPKLYGKKLVVSLTSGATSDCYSKNGRCGCTIDDLLNPIKATCNLCNIEYCGYIYTGGVSYSNRSIPGKVEEMKKECISHANKLTKKLEEI